MKRWVLVSAMAVVAMASQVSAQTWYCTGDCNRNDQVTVDELIVAVNIALDGAPYGSCEAVDRNADRQVTVDEIVQAVVYCLDGCPTGPTPVPTRTSTPSLSSSLRVVVTVQNIHGGTAGPADTLFSVNAYGYQASNIPGPTDFNGITFPIGAGSYQVTARNLSGYNGPYLSNDCSGVAFPSSTSICVITYTDMPSTEPTLTSTPRKTPPQTATPSSTFVPTPVSTPQYPIRSIQFCDHVVDSGRCEDDRAANSFRKGTWGSVLVKYAVFNGPINLEFSAIVKNPAGDVVFDDVTNSLHEAPQGDSVAPTWVDVNFVSDGVYTVQLFVRELPNGIRRATTTQQMSTVGATVPTFTPVTPPTASMTVPPSRTPTTTSVSQTRTPASPAATVTATATASPSAVPTGVFSGPSITLPSFTISRGVAQNVDVIIDNAEGIHDFDVLFTYDPALLSLTTVQSSAETCDLDFDTERGEVRVTGFCDPPLGPGPHGLMAILLQGNRPGTSPIVISACDFDDLTCQTRAGSITVNDPNQ